MTFCLNVFFIYLPTIKDLVEYYKFRNEVMVWFMQMICLHSIANDAEENPGPIVFLSKFSAPTIAFLAF